MDKSEYENRDENLTDDAGENTTTHEEPPPDPTAEEPQPASDQLYQVEEMALNASLVPAGNPIEVTAMFVKVRGEDPFPVELSVSGSVVEERQVYFGESDQVEEKFIIVIDTQGRYEVHMGGFRVGFEVREKTFNITGGSSGGSSNDPSEDFVWTPIEWEPDPLTWNMTSILPPEASPVRLKLPMPIDSLYGFRWAGIGGMGLHAGGHIEGLDHVWIETTYSEPIGSWANGTVMWVQLSGDIDMGEYHIGIDYGDNLEGVHMEVATPLVEVGDYVKVGDPVGYGWEFWVGIQSAELSLVDYGRTDGIKSGNGVLVSPFDYLVETDRIALSAAYIENVIEPYMETGSENGMFEPAQPYFTNRLLIHWGHEGKLHGEWYLVSQNWSAGYPNDMITIIEAKNSYFDGAIIRGMDDFSEGGVSDWNINSDLHIDYENGRFWFMSWTGKKTYGIFEVDESGNRAILRLEYQTGGYPAEFSDDALTYTERSYHPRRMDAVLLGVRDEQ